MISEMTCSNEISVITLLAALLAAALDESNKFRGLSLGLALTFLALATRAYLYQFHLLYQEHPLISGVTYVDDNAVIPGLLFLTGSLLVGAAVSAYNVQACRVRNFAIAAGLPVLVYVFAWVLVPQA